MKKASAVWQGLFFWSAPAERSGDGALSDKLSSLSLTLFVSNSRESKQATN
jgi:hypothetical protein